MQDFAHTTVPLKHSERRFNVSLAVTSTHILIFPSSDLLSFSSPCPDHLREWPGTRRSFQKLSLSSSHMLPLSFLSNFSSGPWNKQVLQDSVAITWMAYPGPVGHMWVGRLHYKVLALNTSLAHFPHWGLLQVTVKQPPSTNITWIRSSIRTTSLCIPKKNILQTGAQRIFLH